LLIWGKDEIYTTEEKMLGNCQLLGKDLRHLRAWGRENLSN